FKDNPAPFYTLAKELNPKHFRPTKTHQFFKLLETKKKLKKCFTQNIDTLERLAGVSEHLIVEAHGSFATSRCIECRSKMSGDQFVLQLDQIHPPDPLIVKCPQRSCFGKRTALVKPDIVFFGEQLPAKFFKSLSDFQDADLLIVLGTSLQVHPFASLISTVPIHCPRVLINLEAVGEAGRRSGGAGQGGFDFEGIHRGGKKFTRDVLVLGTTDDRVGQLCDLLAWKDELLALCEPKRQPESHGEGMDSSNHEDIPQVEMSGGNNEAEEKASNQKDDDHSPAARSPLPSVPGRARSSSPQAESKLLDPQPESDDLREQQSSSAVARSRDKDGPRDSSTRKSGENVDQLITTVTHLSLSENL
ncbi:hypothetical protein PCASD_21994, partial [Puccinia coronata f. sp. avenae]